MERTIVINTSVRPQIWLITGCSSGIGEAIAARAIAQGQIVVVTARNSETLAPLVAKAPDRVLALDLDVTQPDQRRGVVAEVEERFGPVDVLVNNAGYCYYAAVEEGEDDIIHTLFETHVFGAMALIRLVLPRMRTQRHGRIVNISSTGGVTGYPGTGYYCGAKHAVEGLSESLAAETAPLGIRVLLVEPGPFHTRFISTSRKTSPIEIPDYSETTGRFRHGSPNRVMPGDPARLAKTIVDATLSPDPPFRLLGGRFAYDQLSERMKARLAEYEGCRDLAYATDFQAGEDRAQQAVEEGSQRRAMNPDSSPLLKVISPTSDPSS